MILAMGGLVDSLLMRLVDVKSSFPGLLLTLAIIGMLGPGLLNAVIAMSITGWTGYARIIRGMTLFLSGDGVRGGCEISWHL